MSVLWVCSCLWCLVPEFLVIFDCILVIAFEKLGMNGSGAGEKYFPPERVRSQTPGDTTCPRLPEAKLRSGVFALPGGSQQGRSSSGCSLHQGSVPEGRVSCYFHLPWAGLGFLPRHLVKLSLTKAPVFCNQQTSSG